MKQLSMPREYAKPRLSSSLIIQIKQSHIIRWLNQKQPATFHNVFSYITHPFIEPVHEESTMGMVVCNYNCTSCACLNCDSHVHLPWSLINNLSE